MANHVLKDILILSTCMKAKHIARKQETWQRFQIINLNNNETKLSPTLIIRCCLDSLFKPSSNANIDLASRRFLFSAIYVYISTYNIKNRKGGFTCHIPGNVFFQFIFSSYNICGNLSTVSLPIVSMFPVLVLWCWPVMESSVSSAFDSQTTNLYVSVLITSFFNTVCLQGMAMGSHLVHGTHLNYMFPA